MKQPHGSALRLGGAVILSILLSGLISGCSTAKSFIKNITNDTSTASIKNSASSLDAQKLRDIYILPDQDHPLIESGQSSAATDLTPPLEQAIKPATHPTSKKPKAKTPTTENTTQNTVATGGDHTKSPATESADLWPVIRAGFGLKDLHHEKTFAQRVWYRKHPEYIKRVVQRARPYLYFIVQEVKKRDMPLEIALLPIVESAFQPFAYSPGRAAGIWQFIPSTGRHYGLHINWWYDGRRDITASTRAALTYLTKLHKDFDGDWLLALAAYNCGEGTVQRAINKNLKAGKKIDFWSLDLPRETSSYVPKLLAISSVVKNPERYGIELAPIANQPYFAEIKMDSQIDLALIAEISETPIEQVYLLNPGFNRWATEPDYKNTILLPVKSALMFRENLALIPPQHRVQWKRHKIRPGETLGHIAQRYHTTVSMLKKANNMRNTRIRAGKRLIIPISSSPENYYKLSADSRRLAYFKVNRKGTKIIHTVVKGDTLWDISRLHHVSIKNIASWNAMAPRDYLRPGQKLVLWTKNTTSTQLAALKNRDRLTTRRITYIVRPGDSLARISQRFNVSIDNMKQWNKEAQAKYLQPGQRLKLYIDVTRTAENI